MKQLVLLCLISLSFTLLYASIVEDTCKNVTGRPDSYDFCVTSFQAAPGSHTADKYELAVIGLQLSLANHTYNLAKAKELQQQPPPGSDPKKRCMDVCVVVYESSLAELNEAIENAQKKLSFGIDIASAGTEVSTCEQAFEEAGEKDLLATENRNAFMLDCIMSGIANLLHPWQ